MSSRNTRQFLKLPQVVPEEDLLVWGHCRGFGLWPGRIANQSELDGPTDARDDPTRWIHWFGDGKYTETKVSEMTYFYNFWQVFKENVYNHKKLYRKAVNDAIKEAAKRLGKELPENESNGTLLTWVKNNLYSPNSETTTAGDKVYEVIVTAKSSFNQELLSYSVKDKEISCQLKMSLKKVQEKCLDLEKVCLVCGKSDISCLHPLFVGGLCNNCQVGYWESLHVMDDDGYYMYCCVCGGGTKLLLCDNQNCCRCFCTFCLDVLIKENVSCQHLSISPWLCFLCIEKSRHGFLIRRDGWFESLNSFVYKDFSTKNAEIMELPAVVPLNKRRPIRVLSLFDGISTGLLALKKLNIMVECYYASEIDLEAICVAQVQHSHQVVHIGDIRKIYDKQLLEWGPFDLVIGGSPCNDLSIVNPARKGIWSSDGSGVLFFEFVRVLRSCQLIASCNNQFLYWIFENVVSMDRASKATITHFLQKDPVCLDAKQISPAHRPRYFWGNLPGMKRPMFGLREDTVLTLQECLEPGRTATITKLRTITTNLNSIQSKCIHDTRSLGLTDDVFNTAAQRNRLDSLWITEIERVFGFPDHYTDACNMTRLGRLRILGKAWSVPVIKHLFIPLKDYFSSC